MFLHVFKPRDIIIGPEYMIHKLLQGTGPLRKPDKEVMFETFVLKTSFLYFLHPVYIIVASTYNAYNLFTPDLISEIFQCRNGHSTGGLHNNRVFIIQLQNG